MCSVADGAIQFKRQLESDGRHVLLSASTIEAVSRSVGYRGRRCFWTPAVTAMTFLRQILCGNCSCRQAVSMTVSQSAAGDAGLGGAREGWVSGDPSAYAQARSRLPLVWFAALHRSVVDGLLRRVAPTRGRDRAAPAPRWCGRRVFLVDGSTVSMSDAPALQAAFPQPYGQKAGCGFPQARLTAIFCHASGALLDLAVDSLRFQELSLLRRMMKHFRHGDVIVGDRAYHSYVDFVQWVRHGLDVVLRLNEAAWPNLSTRRRLGPDDQIAVWHRPKGRNRQLTPAQWSELPETVTVRLVRVRVAIRGFRTRRMELMTTLLDAATFSADALAELYRDRWMAELNLRHLKTTLRMEVLRGQSPDMIRKEVFMYAVTYNLVRTFMWHAAVATGRDPRRLSFAGAQQRVAAMLPYLGLCRTSRQRRALTRRLLEFIAADRLTDRPDRIEPRARKRRPKSYPPLSIPRTRYRQNLLKKYAA